MKWTSEKVKIFERSGDYLKVKLRDSKISKLLEIESEFPNKSPFYRNDPNLRAANIPFELSDDEIRNIINVKNNPTLLNFEDHPTFKSLRDCQIEMINNYQLNRFNLVINSRQSGATHALCIQSLHYIISNFDKNIFIMSDKSKSSERILERIKNLYLHLPFYIKPGIKSWSKKRVQFDNGCSIYTSSTKGNLNLSRSFNFVILDNYAFYSENMARSISMAMMPTIAARVDSRLTILSSINGDNHFKRMVDTKSRWVKQYIHWSQIPGRDENWKKDMIKIVGIEDFAQEFELLFPGTKEYVRYTNLNNILGENCD